MKAEKKMLSNINDSFIEKDSDIVSLFYNDASYMGYGRYNYNIYIKVKNIDYEKIVSVYYNAGEGWTKSSAQYVGKLNDSTFDIFKAKVSNVTTLKYYITYTVKGETFKDDNEGKYYTNEVLGSAPMCAVRAGGEKDVYLRIRKYDKNKKVYVHYTVDNWKTVEEDIELTKIESYDDGTELWNAELKKVDNIDCVKYVFYCRLYNSVYWDNNFGNNYDGSFIAAQ